MIRSFLPVGQGAFYYEHFESDETTTGEAINVIYDCGSSTGVKIVEEKIKRNFKREEKINALVISHLHEDHVNGIPYLLKHCKVEKVYFPQITPENKELMKIYLKLNNVNKNDFVWNLLMYGGLNGRWSEIEDGPQFIPVPEFPEENEQMQRDIADKIKLSYPGIKWNYIPFNFRNKQRIKIIKEELKKEGISLSDIVNMDDSFFEQNKDKLRKIYGKVPGKFNTNSMTLFSGACAYGVRQNIPCIRRGVYRPICCCKTSGCLFMGDYDASGKIKWAQLKNAYQLYWDYIGCVQVPHHGSIHNFNDKLFNIDAEFVISAGSKNKDHPHPELIKKLVLRGKWPYIVTEKSGSTLRIKIIHL
ncbi:MBL fold metallo-hydrolase [Blautia obeum]|uniref:MBL fold metallo-hydrolase n=1 Tax=Blautia obeum TaxID=40520 RepID=UPI001D082B94|nr:MBL fold metallo-hydrolase [Blautia obeum]MCB7343988.1 MBL fold metallo-hydrolase [Blautia obeum]